MDNSDFKVPKDYFRQKKVSLKQISTERRNVFQLYPWRSGFSIAASICLLISLSLYYLYPQDNKQDKLEQVSASALDEFISYSPYSAYPEAYLLEEESIEWEETNAVKLFNEESIDNYLNEYTNEFL